MFIFFFERCVNRGCIGGCGIDVFQFIWEESVECNEIVWNDFCMSVCGDEFCKGFFYYG